MNIHLKMNVQYLYTNLKKCSIGRWKGQTSLSAMIQAVMLRGHLGHLRRKHEEEGRVTLT